MKDKNKFNYVYITTNLITEKQYIGDHSTNNIDDGYLGSGIYLFKSVQKQGKENFNKQILKFFNTKQEAFNAQEKYIRLYKTHISQGGYNISWKGGHQVKNSVSEETKRKISKNNARWNKGIAASEESKEKNRQAHLGKYHSEETKKQMSESHFGVKNGFYGKTHSKAFKMKMSEIKKGNNLRLGKYHSEETKKKVSEGLKKYWTKRRLENRELVNY